MHAGHGRAQPAGAQPTTFRVVTAMLGKPGLAVAEVVVGVDAVAGSVKVRGERRIALGVFADTVGELNHGFGGIDRPDVVGDDQARGIRICGHEDSLPCSGPAANIISIANLLC